MEYFPLVINIVNNVLCLIHLTPWEQPNPVTKITDLLFTIDMKNDDI